MRSMVVREGGKPLTLEWRELPAPGRGEVRIKVRARGIRHGDKLVTDALGGGGEQFAVGDRVAPGWHGGHDGPGDVCLTGRFIHCRNRRFTGISYDGGYSEYVIAPA